MLCKSPTTKHGEIFFGAADRYFSFSSLVRGVPARCYCA